MNIFIRTLMLYIILTLGLHKISYDLKGYYRLRGDQLVTFDNQIVSTYACDQLVTFDN